MALALGLLVGLQREWAEKEIAGIRTFPLITVFGALCAGLAEVYGGWLVGAGLLVTALMLAVADFGRATRGVRIGGVTTELSALVMFVVGALLTAGQVVPALVVSGATVVLLQARRPLHALVARIDERELRAVSRLVLVALVVLPVLPDRTFDPYEAVNPRQVWTIVVLIVGISLAGHLVRKALGPRAGTIVGGLLGGVVSSTATTFGEARRTRDDADQAPASAAIVLLAAMVVFARLIVEVAVVAPSLVGAIAPPLAVMLGWMLIPCAIAVLALRGAPTRRSGPEDPTDIVGAIVFGLLYAGVLLLSAWATSTYGTDALYVVAAVTGTTDLDAVTLSTAQLAGQGAVAPDTAWRVVVVASLANLVFKGGVVVALGSGGLRRRVVPLIALALLGGVLLLWLAP